MITNLPTKCQFVPGNRAGLTIPLEKDSGIYHPSHAGGRGSTPLCSTKVLSSDKINELS